jgi:predicted nucleic acid-binding protein
VIYLDSCALIKLVHAERESSALRALLSARAAEPQVTSELARAEVVRGTRRAVMTYGGSSADLDSATSAARDLVERMSTVAVDLVIDEAGIVGSPLVRTLDAVHLVSALALGSRLSTFITYDKRLADAATAAGLTVEAPV